MIAFLYELIYASVLSVIFSSAAAPYMGLTVMIAVVAVSVVITAGMVAFKRLGWSVRFIMIGIMAAVILAAFLISRNDIIGEFMNSHIYLLWILAPCAAAFAAGELCTRARLCRILFTALAVVACIAAVACKYQPERATVIGVLSLVLIVLTEEIQHSWDKSGYTDHTGHLVFVSPFLLIAMLLVSVCHMPDEAYDWAFVRELYHMAYDKVQEISVKFNIQGPYDPAGTMIGFSGRGGIHEEVSGGSGEVLTLYDIPQGMACVKLSGRTFDTFDGYEWTDTDTSDAPDVMLDTLSLLASVRDYSDEPQDYIKKSSLRIRYNGINTSYVFTPLKALTDGKEIAGAGVTSVSGDLLWPETRSFRTEYMIPFYRINTDNELFEGYLRHCAMPSEENFAVEARMFAPAGSRPYEYDDLTDHVEHIKSVYASPVTLSDDMSALMADVYAGAEDTYERMDRLEKFLRTLTYSNSPGPLPEDMDDAGDFLDHFVLDTRMGYCSHFATAFVLLARAEGVPARFVQGYIVDTTGPVPVRVDSAMAHAWPEVYYDGAGWIAYEPTPIYSVRSYWRSAQERRAMYDEAAAAYPGDEDETGVDTSSETDDDEDDGIRIPWYAIVVPAVSGILLAVLFIVMGNMIVMLRFRAKADEEKLVMMCRQDMSLLRQLECEMNSGETLNEYRIRLLEELGEKPLGFIERYSEYLYRGDTDIAAGLDAAEQSYKELKAKLKKLYPLRYLRYYMGFQRG